ncbi:hypothetical protein [Parerythrobacter jejuensis]|uniref:Phage tail protein n=1 Tax=Parerythrobacter jejuensis TaxID=795812 RepID=A0A845AZ49_9SPHN|nr:hypothetical protein [Parerythrobacter jejuensis]MXP31271.1 hypothetical protein [Parerythrobacter jejuensis]MXP34031.1 hypothetical protein [Parerythrobacter jejuensis]
MPLPQLTIDQAPAKVAMHPARADVPLFVGMVARSERPLPPAHTAWLEQSDYAGSGQLARSAVQQESLLDVPMPIDSFAEFEQLFDWRSRPLQSGSPDRVPSRLGLAVEQFFNEGGARCWVVRTGDPLPVMEQDASTEANPDDIAAYQAHLSWAPANAPADAAERVPLLPGLVGNDASCDPQDPATWRASGHILGLDEAAYICLPDLPDLVSGPAIRLPDPDFPVIGEEQFIPCAPEDDPVPQPEGIGRPALAAPRMGLEEYRTWAIATRHLLTMMAGRTSAAHRRDVIHVAALPLPDLGDPNMPAEASTWPLSLDDTNLAELDGLGLFSDQLVGSGRQVLAYPWLATKQSTSQPEAICGGEGALLGLIARRTLGSGLHKVATGPLVSGVRDLEPAFPADILRREPVDSPYQWLGDCLCLFGWRRSDLHLLCDVTTSRQDAWRDGQASRIVGALLRHARLIGQEVAFGDNGPASWSRAKESIEQLLGQFWQGGALAGGSAAEAFEVQCDRSTMLQSDIDQGRVIANVRFRPTRTLQHIAVSLDVVGGGA